MIITDEELVRLKERGKHYDFTASSLMSREHFEGLFTRLETAEDHLAYHKCVESVMKCPKAEAYRKASGRV